MLLHKISADDYPDDWSISLLDEVTKRGSGHTPDKKRPEYWNGGVKWVSLSDSSKLDKGYIYETDNEISLDGLKNSSAVLHPINTVVISRDAGIGKSGVLASEMAVSQHFIAWQCDNKSLVNSWYLYYWLQQVKPEIERQAVGSTIKTIGLPYFKKIRFPHPDYREQERITRLILDWSNAIDTTERLIENTRAQKKALMQQLLTGKRRLLRFEDEWVEHRLQDVCTFLRGQGLSKDQVVRDGDYPCVLYGELYTRYREVIEHVLSRTSTDGGVKSVVGDVLIPASTTTTGIDLANATALNENGVRLGGDINILRPNKEMIDSNFLAYLLTHAKKSDLARLAQGSTIVHLYGKDIKKVLVSLPEKSEQKAISNVILASDKEIRNLELMHEKLQKEKKALLQQLLAGKRRVKVDKAAA